MAAAALMAVAMIGVAYVGNSSAVILAVIAICGNISAAVVVSRTDTLDYRAVAASLGAGLSVVVAIGGLVSYGLAVVPSVALWFSSAIASSSEVTSRLRIVGSGFLVGASLGLASLLLASRVA